MDNIKLHQESLFVCTDLDFSVLKVFETDDLISVFTYMLLEFKIIFIVPDQEML